MLGENLLPEEVFLVTMVMILTHIIIVYINLTGISIGFVFVGIMERVGEVLLSKEYLNEIEQTNDKYSIELENASFS